MEKKTTCPRKEHIQMRGSLSLPFGFLCVKYLVDMYALAYIQERTIPAYIVEYAEAYPRARTRAGITRVRSGQDETKTKCLHLSHVRLHKAS